MQLYSYRNTMATAAPKAKEADGVLVRSMNQIRAEKLAETRAKERRIAEEARARMESIIAEYRVIEVVQKKPNSRQLIERIARKHGLTFRDIISVTRARFIVAARDEAIRVVADARPDMSLPALGKIFKRDHTTILHSLRKTAAPGKHHRSALTQERE